ncbi:MAG TPA: DUF4350 domain-containing protein, partial [Gemmatimonadales bacterium]|nr:DUF4350 domain-containing protein [Gemmatimonadales bacterium]
MRQRTELGLGAGIVFVLGVAAGLIGLQRARLSDTDPRRSTYLAGPSGARGFAEALGRLGVTVEAFRRPIASIDTVTRPGTITAFLDPSLALTSREGQIVAGLPGDILLAGVRATAAMRCLGWDAEPRSDDSLAVVPPPGGEARRFFRARAVLVRRDSAEAVDSASAEDDVPVRCTIPAATVVDTLLRTTGGSPVVVRLGLRNGRTATLVADGRLFTNRALRETAAGPFVLGLVVPRYRRVLVDEYHHGFDASRSLSGATVDWTLRSPWGWAILQLAGVGVLALLASGVRFGPIRSGIERRRRSPIEHVRALATALAAARGHDVAVRLIVQGLRRRLSATGRSAPGD